MAKVFTPLMSTGARQSIGDVLTFQRSARLTRAQAYVVPSDARTGPQLALRGYSTSAVRFYQTYIQSLSLAAAWTREVNVNRGRMSGYNQAVSMIVQALWRSDPTSFAIDAEQTADEEVTITFADVRTGAAGTEAGDFDIYVGNTTQSMTLYASMPIVAGAIVIPSLLPVDETRYIQLKKNSFSRTGIIKLKGIAMAQLTYVPRTVDPGAWDFTEADLTRDDAWHDLDCSGIVPANAVGIVLSARLSLTATARSVWFSHPDQRSDFLAAEIRTVISNVRLIDLLTVPCDADRKISYKAISTNWGNMQIQICSWFLYE